MSSYQISWTSPAAIVRDFTAAPQTSQNFVFSTSIILFESQLKILWSLLNSVHFSRCLCKASFGRLWLYCVIRGRNSHSNLHGSDVTSRVLSEINSSPLFPLIQHGPQGHWYCVTSQLCIQCLIPCLWYFKDMQLPPLVSPSSLY